MIHVNIGDAKAQLSYYIQQAVQGQQVVICYHNKPIIELKPVQPVKVNRPLGIARNQIKVIDNHTIEHGWTDTDLSDWFTTELPHA